VRFDHGTQSWSELAQVSAPADAPVGDAATQVVIGDAGIAVGVWRVLGGDDDIVATARTMRAPGGIRSLSPVRLFDTRPGESPDAIRRVSQQPVGGDTVLEVTVTDLGWRVPASGVGAVSLNVTVVDPVASGFVTVWPCGDRPGVSSVNYVAGETVANAVIVPVSPAGTVCFASKAPADLVVDIDGWFSAV
jgi:hypothetical protein